MGKKYKRGINSKQVYFISEVKYKINSKNMRCGLDSSGSGQEPVAGSCEHGNDLRTKNARNFLTR
jgi:hypothetical protein